MFTILFLFDQSYFLNTFSDIIIKIIYHIYIYIYIFIYRECPHGVMLQALNCGILRNKFEFQSHYYVHFQANTLRKSMNPLILPSMVK